MLRRFPFAHVNCIQTTNRLQLTYEGTWPPSLLGLPRLLEPCQKEFQSMMLLRRRSAIIRLLIAFASLVCPLLMAQQERGDKEVAFQGTVSVPFQNAKDGATGVLIPRFGYYLSRRNFVGIENVDIFAKGYQSTGINLLYRFYLGKRSSRFQPYIGAAPGYVAQWQPFTPEIVVTQASVTAAANQIANATNLTAAQKQDSRDFLNREVQEYQRGLFCPDRNALDRGQCSKVPVSRRKVGSRDFQGSGEIGAKFYLNRKFAFEISYRLLYVHQSTSFSQDLYAVTNSTLTPTNQTITFTGPTRNDGQRSGNVGFKQSANSFVLFGFSYVF